MAYTDQQIRDYAYKLQKVGAPPSDIEEFVKRAKAEQSITTTASKPVSGDKQVGIASSIGGALLKGVGQYAPDTTAPAPKYMMGGMNGQGMSLKNPSEVTPEKMQENIPKFGQPLKNEYYPQGYTPGAEFNTPGTERKGILPKIFGTSANEYDLNTTGEKGLIPQTFTDVYQANKDGRGFNGAITGYNEQGKELNANERFMKALQGVASVVNGTLGTAFAAPGAVLETAIPQSKEAFQKIGEWSNEASSYVARGMAEHNGWDAETEKAMQMHLNNLFTLGTVKAGDVVAGQLKLPEGFKNDMHVLKGRAGEVASNAVNAGIDAAGSALNKGVDVINQGVDATRNAVPKLQAKEIDALEADYYKWAGQTKPGVKMINKTEARTAKLDAAGTTGRTPQRVLAENGIIPETQGTKFSTAEQAGKIRESTKPLVETQREAIQMADKVSPPIKTDALMEETIRSVRTKENIASGKAAKLEAEIRREFAQYKVEYGDEMPLSTVNEIKSARWADSKFDFTQPLKGDTNYAIAKTAQKAVENTAKKAGLEDIAQLNREIGDKLEAAKYLEALDGNTLKGGKLGQYVYRTLGATAGMPKGVIGTVLGAIGGDIIGNLLMKKSVATATRRLLLKAIKEADPVAYKQVIEWMKSPEAQQRLLSAPKEGTPRSQVGSGAAIELPSNSQSTIDAAEQGRIQGQQFVKKATAPMLKQLPAGSIQLGGRTYEGKVAAIEPKVPPTFYKKGGSMKDVSKPKTQTIKIKSK